MFEGYRDGDANKVSLQDRLQNMAGQPFTVEETFTILGQLGQALCYAHECNVTHGNLKPDAIFFDENGKILLAEFFLHALATQSDNGMVLEASIMALEASIYRAPELLPGQASKEGDQYALGCIAYEMFTGNKPWLVASISKPDTFYHTKKPISPKHFNPTLSSLREEAILKAIAKEPAQRHHDIRCFLTALGVSTDIGDQATSMDAVPVPLVSGLAEQADLPEAPVGYAGEEAGRPLTLSTSMPGQTVDAAQIDASAETAEFSLDHYPVAYNLLAEVIAKNPEASMPTSAYAGLLSTNSAKLLFQWRWISVVLTCLVAGCIIATSLFALFTLRSTQEHKTTPVINTKINPLSTTPTLVPLTPTPEATSTPEQMPALAPPPTVGPTVKPPTPTPTPHVHGHH